MSCSFCNENERESYWSHYCKDCAMLRRMLVLHEPTKCVNILKRCLIRNADQIDNKIKLELEVYREIRFKKYKNTSLGLVAKSVAEDFNWTVNF